MKKILILLFAALFASVTLQAAPSVSTDLSYTSKYVFRGVEVSTGAFQPSVNVEAGNFYLGVWGSAPVEKGYELEFDYTLGYNLSVSEKWSVDLGATVYHYPQLDNAGKKYSTEGYIGLNGELLGFTSETYAFYDRDLKTFTAQQTLGRSFELTSKLSLDLSASVGRVRFDDGSFYTYYGAGANLPYQLSEKTTVTLGAQWADHNLTDGTPGNHVWGTFSVGYKF
jgi:uncharacterized protein (TIGR02001 family)